ncbi:MAG: LysE family translocator [Roseinatronobacter sp.]
MTGVFAAWLAHLLAAASPGPAILLAARTGVTQGFRTGVWLCLGMALGALLWAAAALFGLAALFAVAPRLFWTFKLIGAAFLIWLALGMWRHARDPVPGDTPGTSTPATAGAAFRLGLLAQLANPKPAVFFGAVFIAAVPPGSSSLTFVLLLALVFGNELLCTLAVARAFSSSGPRAAYARAKLWIDRAFGGLLAGLGVTLAAT